jgi:hypothetical protein
MKYIGIAGGLIFVYLVVRNGNDSSNVINALSKANVNAITALQGRGVGGF